MRPRLRMTRVRKRDACATLYTPRRTSRSLLCVLSTVNKMPGNARLPRTT